MLPLPQRKILSNKKKIPKILIDVWMKSMTYSRTSTATLRAIGPRLEDQEHDQWAFLQGTSEEGQELSLQHQGLGRWLQLLQREHQHIATLVNKEDSLLAVCLMCNKLAIWLQVVNKYIINYTKFSYYFIENIVM